MGSAWVTAGSPPTRRGKQQSSQAVQCEEKGQVETVERRDVVVALGHADFSHLSPACSASRASSARDRREESAQAAKVQTTSVTVSAAQTAQNTSSITTAITSHSEGLSTTTSNSAFGGISPPKARWTLTCVVCWSGAPWKMRYTERSLSPHRPANSACVQPRRLISLRTRLNRSTTMVATESPSSSPLTCGQYQYTDGLLLCQAVSVIPLTDFGIMACASRSRKAC